MLLQDPANSWAVMTTTMRDARTDRLAKLLARSATIASTDYRLWDVFAVFRQSIGEPQKALDCRLKQCRALQGKASGADGWTTNPKAFDRVGKAVLQTTELYFQVADKLEGSAATAKLRECRFFVDGVLRRASSEHVGETSMYAKLTALQEDVKVREGVAS